MRAKRRSVGPHARIRWLIDEGRLPVFLSDKIAAGHGIGSTCDACDRTVSSKQVEYEVEVPGSGAPLILHLECYMLWQIECAARMRGQHQDSPGDDAAPLARH